MPNAGEANKKRGRVDDGQAGLPSKKSCDPKGDANAPKTKDTPAGKKAAKQTGPIQKLKFVMQRLSKKPGLNKQLRPT